MKLSTRTLLISIVAAIPSASAQPSELSFEVATVKPNSAGDPGQYYNIRSPSVKVTNRTLRGLILFAYRIQPFLLTGGPAWLDSDHWDIEAKATPSASQNDKLQMLQALLKDRFHLAIHREVKDLPVYNMTLAKGGLKIQPIKEGSCLPVDLTKSSVAEPGKVPMDYCGTTGSGKGMIEASNGTMAEFAQQVCSAVERTVIDKTGVTGQFRIHLSFASSGASAPQIGDPSPSVEDPSIFTALQEQLGLRLDSSKGPVEVLVIDHAEKPSDN